MKWQVLVIHDVSDYNKWRPIFDSHENARARAGLTTSRVFRNTERPEEVVVALDVENLPDAREFFSSEGLKNTMQAAGVSSSPKIRFLEEQ